MDVRELKQKRAELIGQARAILDKADTEKRGLTADEQKEYDGRYTQIDAMKADIDRREALARDEAGIERVDPASRPDPTLDMGEGEQRQYSLVRAISAAASGDWRGAEFEREASEATAEKLGRKPEGFFVPVDVLRGTQRSQRVQVPGRGWLYTQREARDLVKGTATAGGYLVGTDLLAEAFIDLLRNRMVLQRAGAMVMGDLVGDVAIPRAEGGATGYWVAESGAPTESQQTLGQVALNPKTYGAFTDISRKLLKQASIDAEAFVRNDLAAVIALGIDLAGLHGTGASNQPTGVAATTGVGAVFAGGAANDGVNANGAAPVWADIINLEREVAIDNADVGNLAYICNATMRGTLKQTAKVASTDSRMIWNDAVADTPLNGYPAFVTNQVASNLTKGAGTGLSAFFFGNWADLVFAMWGTLDILVDPYTGGTSGTVRVIALQDVDVAVRHPQSFAFGDDFVA